MDQIKITFSPPFCDNQKAKKKIKEIQKKIFYRRCQKTEVQKNGKNKTKIDERQEKEEDS